MELAITEFASRKTSEGKLSMVSWTDLVERLKSPVITLETISDYQGMTNEQRTEVKDVGGFVGGSFVDNRRSKANLISRTILTIDADAAKYEDIADFRRNPCTGLPLYFCHTTHTSTQLSLRLRWLFPLARPVNAYEYTQLARVVMRWVGNDSADETTDQPERLMFWPSVSLDGEFETWEGGIEPLDPDRWLTDLDELPPVTSSVVSSGVEVLEGSRNVSLQRYGVSLTRSGIEGQQLYDMMREWNQLNCTPPLPEKEVLTTYRSVNRTGFRPVTTEQDFGDVGVYAPRENTPLPPKEEKPVKKLVLESMASITSRDIAPPEYVVSELITTGLTILASPPKYGKSWLCMDLCSSVACGAKFLGMDTKRRSVIYFALEDGEYRIKSRFLKVNGNREVPTNMYIVRKSDGLNDGLMEELKSLPEQVEDLGMIVIDTLQKVRGVARKTEGVYGYDYRELGMLQEFAVANNLAIVLVHHLNKGGDDSDFVSRLNGSMGISGAADSIITLTRANRGDDLTKMSIVGRDVQERTLILRMDWSKWRWDCLGDERDFRESEEEREYHNSGLVKYIQYHMDELEDMIVSDGNYEEVVWETDSSALKNVANAQFGDDLGSTGAVRNKLEGFKDQLLDNNGIRYSYDPEKKKHVFRRSPQ